MNIMFIVRLRALSDDSKPPRNIYFRKNAKITNKIMSQIHHIAVYSFAKRKHEIKRALCYDTFVADYRRLTRSMIDSTLYTHPNERDG
jgi:hypothetical protein